MRFLHDEDRDAWLYAALVLAALCGLAYGLSAVVADREARRERVLAQHRESLACLARNVYFEARGEPLAGQYAVAEVTLNRRGAAFFPRSVCEVVHEKSAFSWTLLGPLPEPAGVEWERAQAVAEAVYYGRHVPVAQGALFYHATYVNPDWARTKRRVAQIGRHIFYR